MKQWAGGRAGGRAGKHDLKSARQKERGGYTQILMAFEEREDTQACRWARGERYPIRDTIGSWVT